MKFLTRYFFEAIYYMGSSLPCFTNHVMTLFHHCILLQQCRDLLIILQEILYFLSRNNDVSNIYIHLAIAIGAITLDWRNTHGKGLSLRTTSPAWNPDISSIFQTIEFSLLFVACPRCISDWLSTYCMSTKVNILRPARHKYNQWALGHYSWYIFKSYIKTLDILRYFKIMDDILRVRHVELFRTDMHRRDGTKDEYMNIQNEQIMSSNWIL